MRRSADRGFGSSRTALQVSDADIRGLSVQICSCFVTRARVGNPKAATDRLRRLKLQRRAERWESYFFQRGHMLYVIGAMAWGLIIGLAIAVVTEAQSRIEVGSRLATWLSEHKETGEALDAGSMDSRRPPAYLQAVAFWGFFIAAMGTALRAYAHNPNAHPDRDRASMQRTDHAGKLLAVSAISFAVGGVAPPVESPIDALSEIQIVGPLIFAVTMLGIGLTLAVVRGSRRRSIRTLRRQVIDGRANIVRRARRRIRARRRAARRRRRSEGRKYIA